MRVRLLLAATLAIVGCPAIRAVVVAGGDGTQNITAPGNGAPWDYVGIRGAGTAVYLGSYNGGYWVITANHIGAGDFSLGGSTYTAVGGSGIQIGGADLAVFRIATDPGLANLALSASRPVNTSQVTMIGAGTNRAAGLTNYFVDTDPDPWVWSTSDFPERDATVSGYAWAGGRTLRWGLNNIDGTTTFNSTTLFSMDFDPISGEGQGATGDSGGAVFYLNGGTWELAGIMDYILTFSGQPGSTAVFDNATLAADISVYRGAILTAIPEPNHVALGFAALAAAVAAARRRWRGFRFGE